MSKILDTCPTVGGASLDRYFHVCAFFDSRDQEYSILGPFYREGLERGENALLIVDPGLRDEHRARFAGLGVDVDGCEKTGKLAILTSADTYLQGRCFDPDKMLATFDAALDSAREKGFPRTRIMGNMDWALEGAPGSDRLIEFESRVNDVLSRTRQPAICVYDPSRLTGAMMLDILRTHPLTLVNGVVNENPFFTPPELFLRELRQRRPRATA